MSALPQDAPLDTIVEAFASACRLGENPTVAEWLEKFPGFAPQLREILPTVWLLELRDDAPAEGKRESPRSAFPERIGEFRIVSELGRGAMGIVFEAIEEPLGRQVALKVLPALHLGSPAERARFQREAEVVSKLDHPGICPVYRAGVEDGIPFLAMRRVGGETLSHVLQRSRESASLPQTREEIGTLLHWIEKVARALQHAHEAGVIHRDVKPQNIMIDPRRGPVILDFGLAREASGTASVTGTGAVCGTPAYLAPEGLRAGRAVNAPEVDVYALGVVLYECLTLRRPFEGPSLDALYRAILHDEPPNPRSLNPALGRDAQAVLATALEKDPILRYRTAAAFADDLAALAAGRPVSVQPPTPIGRAARWARREPAKAILAAALLVSVPSLAGIGGYLAANLPRIQSARDAASRDRVESALEVGFMELSHPGDAAATAFAAALAEDPACVEAIAGIALDHLYDLRPAEAIAALDQRPDLEAACPSLWFIRGTALRRMGRREDAELVEHKIPAPASVNDWFFRGIREMDEGLAGNPEAFQRAQENLKRAVGLCRSARPFYLGILGQCAMFSGNRELAEMTSATLVGLWPKSARSHVWRAIALQTFDRPAAESACRAALSLDQDLELARDLLVEILLGAERFADASSVLHEAVARQPKSGTRAANLAFTQGVPLQRAGDHAAAREHLERAAKLAPEDPRNWTALGDTAVLQGRHRDAVDAFTRAIARNRNWAAAHNGLGRALLHLGDHKGAAESLQESARLRPDWSNSFFNLAVAHDAQGQRKEALAALREAFRLAPLGEHSTWNGFRAILQSEGRQDEVLEFAQKRALGLPSDVQATIDLGDAFLELWQYGDAEAAYRQAIALDPGTSIAHQRLGEALRLSGRFEEAMDAIRTGSTCIQDHAGDQIAWAQRISGCEVLVRKTEHLSRIAAGEPAPESLEGLAELAWIALVTGDAAMVRRLCREAALDSETAPEVIAANLGYFDAAAAVELSTRNEGATTTPDGDGPLLRRAAWRRFRDRLELDRQPAGSVLSREVRIRWLRYLNDPRLAAVREVDRVLALPEAERREWSLLWEDARQCLGLQ